MSKNFKVGIDYGGTKIEKQIKSLKKFFSNKTNKFLFSIFLIFAYFFSALSISEVFEDYISNEKTKYVANRLLYISAIIIPLLTIIILLNLK